MNAGVTKLEQPSGARRLALFAAKKTAIGSVGRRRTSSWRPGRRRRRDRRVGDRSAYSQAFYYRSISRPITRYR